MGFKEMQARAKESAQFQAAFGGYRILNGALHGRNPAGGWPATLSWPLAGMAAELERGATVGPRVTATRVVAGAVVAGPVGALVGGMLRKDRNKVYVVVTLADGSQILIDGPAKDERAARDFVSKLNAAGAHYMT